MKIFFLIVFFLFCLSPLILQAGGPIVVAPSGDPASWVSPISLHPEAGVCATFSNANMRTKIDDNLTEVENVSGVSLSFSIVSGAIAVDVNSSNFNNFYVDEASDPGLNDSLNPVIYDDDGEIIASLFGISQKFIVLGFAGPDGFTSDFSTIVDGQGIFNCRCLAGNPVFNTQDSDEDSCANTGTTFSVAQLDFTMTHELLHMVGLDHTQVNQSLASSCNTAVAGDCDDLPIMYPVIVDAADQLTLQRDDEVALLGLYGLSNLTNGGCTVTGALEDRNGNALRCADIQASTGDTADTIATVSGYFAPYEDKNGDGFSDGAGECLSDCGDFILRGLSVGKTYLLTVNPITSTFIEDSKVGPCRNGQITGIIAEAIASIACSSAGQMFALGTIATSSSGGVDGDGGGSDSSSGCGLSTQEARFEVTYLWIVVGVFLFLVLWRRRHVLEMEIHS